MIIKKFVAHCGRFYPTDGGVAWTVLDQLHNALFNSETEDEVTEGEKALAAFLELGVDDMLPSPWRACQSSKAGHPSGAVFTVRWPTRERLPATDEPVAGNQARSTKPGLAPRLPCWAIALLGHRPVSGVCGLGTSRPLAWPSADGPVATACGDLRR